MNGSCTAHAQDQTCGSTASSIPPGSGSFRGVAQGGSSWCWPKVTSGTVCRWQSPAVAGLEGTRAAPRGFAATCGGPAADRADGGPGRPRWPRGLGQRQTVPTAAWGGLAGLPEQNFMVQDEQMELIALRALPVFVKRRRRFLLYF